MSIHYISDGQARIRMETTANWSGVVSATRYTRQEPKPPEGLSGIHVGEPQWEWIDLTNYVVNVDVAPNIFSVTWEE